MSASASAWRGGAGRRRKSAWAGKAMDVRSTACGERKVRSGKVAPVGVFLPREGDRREDSDEYDEDGYLIIRKDEASERGMSSAREDDLSESGSARDDEAAGSRGAFVDDARRSDSGSDSDMVVLSSVDIFDNSDAALFTDEAPSYDSWRSRNKRKSLMTFRNFDSYEMGADELNDKLKPDFLDRHRHVLKPEEAFGAIFTWEALLSNARELELAAWSAVAAENDLLPPDLDDVARAELMNPELAIQRVFFWTSDWAEVKRLFFRKLEVYNEMFESFKFEVRAGAAQWLEALAEYNTPMCLCASVPRQRMDSVLNRLGLRHRFPFVISAEEEFESIEQMLLLAAVKLERAPQKVVLFTDTHRGVIGAHEVSAKAVALLGLHRAYEMRVADACVRDFDELVVYNVRRLFSQTGAEHMDPVTELEKSRGSNDLTTTQIADR